MLPEARKQSDIAALILRAMNVTAGTRFTTAQTYLAMDNALMTMGDRAAQPFQYTFSITNGTREYTLPIYIDGPGITVQWRSTIWPWNVADGDDEERVWDTVLMWRLYPNATGTRTLRFEIDPPTTDGRILYWATPYPIPTPTNGTLPVTNAEISSSATSVVLTSKPNIGRNGYTKIGSEWMEYHGVTEAASTLTLTNLVRGIFGTTAATQTIGSTVEWGLAFNNPMLYDILQHEAIANLCSLYMLNPGADSDKYENMWKREKQLAYEGWLKVPGSRQGQSRPHHMGLIA